MILPDIPDDVVKAAYEARARGEFSTPRVVLERAWPHLYAAALRHVADAHDPIPGGAAFVSVERLRELAAEVGA